MIGASAINVGVWRCVSGIAAIAVLVAAFYLRYRYASNVVARADGRQEGHGRHACLPVTTVYPEGA